MYLSQHPVMASLLLDAQRARWADHEARQLRYLLGAIAHDHHGLRVSRPAIEMRFGFGVHVDERTTDLILLAKD